MNAAGTSANICAETVPLPPRKALAALAKQQPHLKPLCGKLSAAIKRGDQAVIDDYRARLAVAMVTVAP